ncbi:unnamed protein product [Adineta steineri]|uniref:Uncharacterized protein n=1 Tax=Adineta steineri TaxID=433720 RepID=A0A815EC25_9BILA|nr:unnamed protein product [Adineta steineri]CAF1365452.1 unnamed protein product [Adineta steineri]CAF1380899.1 unnamed protein product [Adineta steineri]CAF3499337.1 unnamed protein product [Adineta steineri]CAF3677310.1 unnamed protein product [Adineta steineri]
MAVISRQLGLLKRWWRLLIIILTPLILLPLPLIIKTIQARCAYIVLILTIYWVFEVMSYAVTSLLPLAFFPMAGILSSDRVGISYFKDISTLFVGSMTLAQAMEHVHLHRRLALFVLSIVGSSVKWSMGGVMVVTAFLSMWINNSAATSIMIPAAVAIIDELQNHEQEMQKRSAIHNNGIDQKSIEVAPDDQKIELGTAYESYPIESNNQTIDNEQKSTLTRRVDYQQLKTAFLIAVAYAAAIGGLATLVGTGPNIFVKGFTHDFYASGAHAFEISFTNFLLFAFPIGFVMLILCWLWLQLLYNHRELLPWLKKSKDEIASQKHLQSVLKEQYKELGSPSWQERIVAILFVIMVTLWITRDFSTYPGWEIIFVEGYVTDGTVALLIGVLPLILPNKNPFDKNWEYHPILQWDQLSKKFPWGVFMLQGAGLAIADGFKESNLSLTVANFLQFVVGASHKTIIFIVIVLSAIFTEFTSNLACASILFPVLDSIAQTAGIHAARLILPSCMAVSLSFMLPIATPPNAMIFSSGNVRIIQLIKAGIGMKIIGIVIIFFASLVLLPPIFRIQPLISVLNDTLLFSNSTSS